MPGPSNGKGRKRKSQVHGQKKKSGQCGQSRPSLDGEGHASSTSSSPASPLKTPSPIPVQHLALPKELVSIHAVSDGDCIPDIVPQMPCIYDPGNGARVRDTRAFLTSSFFAQSPALDDPLCAEFAQEEVLEMLCTVLPEETALVSYESVPIGD